MANGASGEENSVVRDDIAVEHNYTSDGRYIPYSGGSAGWDDNAGVLKRESGNNYGFHQVMNASEVRVAQFQRMGQRFDRRGHRVRVLKEVGVNLVWQGGNEPGLTRDISMNGIRIQFSNEIPLSMGDAVTVQILDKDGSLQIAVESEVAWARTLGNLRPLWNLGLAFTGVTREQTERLREFVGL